MSPFIFYKVAFRITTCVQVRKEEKKTKKKAGEKERKRERKGEKNMESRGLNVKDDKPIIYGVVFGKSRRQKKQDGCWFCIKAWSFVVNITNFQQLLFSYCPVIYHQHHQVLICVYF